MGNLADQPASDLADMARRVQAGDRSALGALFEHYRERLLRMVDLRLDSRVRGRLDPADVLQDAFVDAVTDLDRYRRDPRTPPFLWLRAIVAERMALVHRQHLGVKMRDAGREVALYREALPQASTAALASMLLGRLTSPTQAAQRAERLLRIQEALNSLDPIDREVLSLRHFEQLNRAEAALALGISEEAGAKRYIRALKRMKDVMSKMPGGLEGF
jgi:RNA polymerase sigma-70 factor (ECF subfamily)